MIRLVRFTNISGILHTYFKTNCSCAKDVQKWQKMMVIMSTGCSA